MVVSIRAKILNVLVGGSVAINAGKLKGVKKNMQLQVLNGKVRVAIVKVTEVYDSFSIAENFANGKKTAKITVGNDVIEYIAK